MNVLWVVHPAMLDDTTLYAIDQFVMRGGHALIFVDPMAEILAGAAPDPASGFGGSQASSSLDKLFTAWGVKFNTQRRRHGQQVRLDASAAGSDLRATSACSGSTPTR